MTSEEINRLVNTAIKELEYRRHLDMPTEVDGGAVWKDGEGRLTGDLRTSGGPVSFHGATIGASIAPDFQLESLPPAIDDDILHIREIVRSIANDYSTGGVLRGLNAIRGQLEECTQFVEGVIRSLSCDVEPAKAEKVRTNAPNIDSPEPVISWTKSKYLARKAAREFGELIDAHNSTP